MRISDWSSDVCSSDLVGDMPAAETETGTEEPQAPKTAPVDALGLKVSPVTEAVRSKQKITGGVQVTEVEEPAATAGLAAGERNSDGEGNGGAGGVDIGGCRTYKKKKKT